MKLQWLKENVVIVILGTLIIIACVFALRQNILDAYEQEYKQGFKNGYWKGQAEHGVFLYDSQYYEFNNQK